MMNSVLAFGFDAIPGFSAASQWMCILADLLIGGVKRKLMYVEILGSTSVSVLLFHFQTITHIKQPSGAAEFNKPG